MRSAGVIPDKGLAKRFADFLLTRGIITRIDEDTDGFAIWVREEQYIEESRIELRLFLANPNGLEYEDVEREAEELRQAALRLRKEQKKDKGDVRSSWKSASDYPLPLTQAGLVSMLLLTLVTWFGENQNAQWFFIAPFQRVGSEIQWNNLQAISSGDWWRLVTPVFMHGDPIHLLFGLYMFFQFGRLVEGRRGSFRFLPLVLIAAVVSNLAEYWIADFRMWPETGIVQPNPAFLGMSGVIYALFGYAWIRGRVDPASGLVLNSQTVFVLMLWFCVCIVGLSSIANIAHASGLLTGMVIGYLPAIVPQLGRWT